MTFPSAPPSKLFPRNASIGLVTALVGLSAFPGTGCRKAEVPTAAITSVQVVEVERRDVPVYMEAIGTLEADVTAVISAQTIGNIVSRDYIEGSTVTSNQALFRIDDRSYKAALAVAQAKVNKTEKDVERYRPLAARNAISQQELDDAIQANAAAIAVRDQAQINFENCTVRAPIAGDAGLAKAQVGDLVGPGTGPLLTVAKVQPMRVSFSVSQQWMTEFREARLAQGEKLGQLTQHVPLKITLATGAAYPEPGEFKFADNQVDVRTGTVRVVGEFPNAQKLLVPGMFVRVQVAVGVNQGALLVQQRAVSETQWRKFVAVVDPGGKVRIVTVSTGETVGNMRVVSGPLEPGDRIVVEGIQKAREGVLVNPKPWDGGTNVTASSSAAANRD